ncbi:hypothetical protein PMAYCL1PPCAC_24276, partial [Pristionchus mayeri]
MLPWPLNNNNANANNNNNGGVVGGVGVRAAPAPAAAAAMRARRNMRGVMGRGWAPGVGRRHSETSTAREHDEGGEGLRMQVGEEVADRFARLKSNQHLAPHLPRTRTLDLNRNATLSEEREAAERALLERFLSCLGNAVGDGLDGKATEEAEGHLLHELDAWRDRVRREREKLAEGRAYLMARRDHLVMKEASLNSASRSIQDASLKMTQPPAPRWSSRF